jgi:hypothetical protein
MDRIKAKLKPWTSQNGEVRYYFDDWYPLISDVIEKYAQEEWMSPDLKKIKRCKVWFDKDASIHVDGIKDEMVIEIIRSNIEGRFFLRSLFSNLFLNESIENKGIENCVKRNRSIKNENRQQN